MNMGSVGLRLKVRCAIYTRKSNEEGLDLEYNSLDNQYDSCKKYIESQQHEGWCLVNKRYDDGGFSGGNLERPALKELLKDISLGLIDMIVVYKIDRLNRSLMDFSKLVEIFDANKTSFISVTQNFNTNDSMGKLMLNILLSFAQFEREMTGDRIRDKIRMQKSKGMWTGGTPILGYNIIDKKLTINKDEAENVRFIFNTFLKTQSIKETLLILQRNNYKTKTYISASGKQNGGINFNRNILYKILKNKIYIGLIQNKSTNDVYQGLHEPIIDKETFDKVQQIFAINLNSKIYDKQEVLVNNSNNNNKQIKILHSPKKDSNIPYLLKGLMKCSCCNSILTPTYTPKKKSGVVYRYYKPNKLMKQTLNSETGKECELASIPAEQIENIVLNQIYGLIRTPSIIQKIIDTTNQNKTRLNNNEQQNLTQQDIINYLKNIEAVWNELFPIEQIEIVQILIKEIIVSRTNIKIIFNSNGFMKLINDAGTLNKIDTINNKPIEVNIPINLKYKSGRSFITTATGNEIIIKNTNYKRTSTTNYLDITLINALIKAEEWNKELTNKNRLINISTIAKRENKQISYICRMLNLIFLAPDIKKAILTGNAPLGLSLKDIKDNLEFEWTEQRRKLGVYL